MNMKIVLASFSFHEKATLETYLNEMSKEGWQLFRLFKNFVIFERGESYHYHVDFSPDYLQKKMKLIIPNQQQVDLYEQFGYTYVDGNFYFRVFSSTKQEPLHSDIVLEKEAMEKAARYDFWFLLLRRYFQLLLVLSYLWIFNNKSMFNMLADSAFVMYLPFMVVIMVDTAMRVHKRKKDMQEGKETVYQKVIERSAFTALQYICLFAILFYGIMSNGVEAMQVAFYMTFFVYLFSLLFFVIPSITKSKKNIIKVIAVTLIMGIVAFIALQYQPAQITSSFYEEEIRHPYDASVEKKESFLMKYENMIMWNEELGGREWNYTYYESKQNFLNDFVYTQIRDEIGADLKVIKIIDGVQIERFIVDYENKKNGYLLLHQDNKFLLTWVSNYQDEQILQELVQRYFRK